MVYIYEMDLRAQVWLVSNRVRDLLHLMGFFMRGSSDLVGFSLWSWDHGAVCVCRLDSLHRWIDRCWDGKGRAGIK